MFSPRAFNPCDDKHAHEGSSNLAASPLWNVKLRLGQAAPAGLSLHDLKLSAWDKNFGGRWNAGSNKRGGGTDIAPVDYAAQVAHCIARCQKNAHAHHTTV